MEALLVTKNRLIRLRKLSGFAGSKVIISIKSGHFGSKANIQNEELVVNMLPFLSEYEFWYTWISQETGVNIQNSKIYAEL